MIDMLSTLKTEIFTAKRAYCNASWDYDYINSSFTRLYHTTSGEAYVVCEGRKYHLRPGALHLFPSHTPLAMHCPKEMTQQFLHFTAEMLNGIDMFKFFRVEREINISNIPRVKYLLNRLEAIWQTGRLEHALETEGIIRILCSMFISEETTSKQTEFINNSMRFRTVFEFMEKHYAKKITLSDLAEQLNLQPTYFSNLFSSRMGMPPIKYLNRKRIEKAQNMLLFTKDSLGEIAEKVGFEDVFYFSKIFKKYVGTAPDHYRKQKKILLR